MRILYVTNGFPYPLTSGYLRHYFLIKELSRRHAVTLLSIARVEPSAGDVAAVRPLTERIVVFPAADRRRTPLRRARRWALSLVGRSREVRRMCETVQSLVQQQPFDAVLLSGKQTYPVLRHIDGQPVVVDMCDAASLRLRGAARCAGLARAPVILLKYLQMRRIETRLVGRAAHLLFASCRDREAIPAASRHPATVIPNGVDLAFWTRSTSELGSDTIVFTGKMDYPPNTDAALYLADKVFPLVRRSAPNAKLLLVGRDPPPRLLEAGRRPGVTVTGFVDDMRPFLERATVFAAPLRFGAGIQNKVLEAMAMQVPVVASPLAADGLRLADGHFPPLRVAEDLVQFADAILERLRRRALDPRPDAEAREFVAEHFVWQRIGEKLEHILRTVADIPKD